MSPLPIESLNAAPPTFLCMACARIILLVREVDSGQCRPLRDMVETYARVVAKKSFGNVQLRIHYTLWYFERYNNMNWQLLSKVTFEAQTSDCVQMLAVLRIDVGTLHMVPSGTLLQVFYRSRLTCILAQHDNTTCISQ